MPAELVPIDEGASLDFLLSTIASWIVMHEQVPVDSKERLTEIIESIISALRKIQSLFPEDQETVKKELLHLIKRNFINSKS